MSNVNSAFSKPWIRMIAGLVGFLFIYLLLGIWADAESRKLSWLIEPPIFCLGSIFWLVFFAQFVIPIRTITQRFGIVKRLFHYLFQSHGPTIFVENGQVKEMRYEDSQRGPGIIWLDSASAAVLRTATSFLPAKGPGLIFTEIGQYIAATVDLHTQRQTIGPYENENPLTIPKEHPDYREIQQRRWETSGMTRDGIEIIASFNILFKVDAEFGKGGTPFGYNQDSVFKAVRDSQVAGASSNYPIWNPIIAKMVVDVWRDYLRKYKLNDLFEVPEGASQTTLQSILQHLNARLAQEKTVELDEFGKITGSELTSSEYHQIKQMGWRVLGVNIKRLLFSDEIEERLATQWTTTWLKNAEKEREQVDRNRKINEIHGQDEALKALEMLVHSTFKGVIRNSALAHRMNTETRDLLEISRWLHDKRGTGNDNP
jgi:hypothetical protein